MMNTAEAIAAKGAIPYPYGAGEKRRDAYRAAQAKVAASFKAWLTDEYAAKIPQIVSDLIWTESVKQAGSESFAAIEAAYKSKCESLVAAN